ncbi:MAG: leucine-rich repeat domain-containing protein [Kiritimatiellae bacterium]|nr:leucine-rich repeat domain-containing protein [Kiritimatiellia bacterium]
MKKILFILCSIVGYCAIGADNFWLYDSAAKTMTWVDETGFENVVKTTSDNGSEITFKDRLNSSSSSIKNLDLSLPIKDANDNEYVITALPASSFSNCSTLERVVLPSTLKSIGDYGFYNCSSLTTFTFNDGLETIGYQAFKNNTALKNVYNFLPSSVTSIGVDAFRSCSALEADVVINSVTTIGNRAFHSSGISSFNGGNSPLSLFDEGIFYGCNYLTNVICPTGLKKIGTIAFQNSKALKSITMNDGLEVIGASAFENCTGLEEIINGFPDSLKEIKSKAFYSTTSLKSDIVANNIEVMEDRIFTKSAIPSFDFEKSTLKKLNTNTFYECKGLTNVAMSLTLEEIAETCFKDCSALTTVKNLLPASIKSLGKEVFVNCTSLTGDVVIGSQLEVLPYRAFRSNKITSFVAPRKGLKNIGQYAFFSCVNLTNIVLSTTLESIDYSMIEETSSSSLERKIYLRNFPKGGIYSSVFIKMKGQSTTVYLPWEYREEWRNFAATNTAHTFTFDGQTGVLPATKTDIGTWKAGTTQNVGWWEEFPEPLLIFIK